MKIEEGKYYRTLDGRKVGPVRHRGKENTDYPFDIDHVLNPHDRDIDCCVWSGDGLEYKNRGLDLISEWPDDNGARGDDYATLRAILDDAYAQAASGKGKERHANDRPFLDQPICEIGRMLGSVCDGELYQAIKKAQEASNMLARGERDKAEHELLGAINYLAAAVILIREEK